VLLDLFVHSVVGSSRNGEQEISTLVQRYIVGVCAHNLPDEGPVNDSIPVFSGHVGNILIDCKMPITHDMYMLFQSSICNYLVSVGFKKIHLRSVKTRGSVSTHVSIQVEELTTGSDPPKYCVRLCHGGRISKSNSSPLVWLPSFDCELN
jgi:hypothetical protein